MTDVIGSLWVTLGLDSSGLDAGINQAEGKVKGLGSSSKVTAQDLTILAGGLTAAATASYMAAEKYGGLAQEIKDVSFQTGLTVEEVQRLNYACVISGTSTGVMAAGVNKLTLSMAEAKDPSSAAYKAFMGLGVDPTGKTPKQVFDETAAALMRIKDPIERNAVAMELYGKNYKEMLPFMQTYIDKGDEIAHSPAMTQAELDRLERGKQGWDRLTNSLTIYSGEAISFILDLQEKLNTNNLVAKWLGWDTSETISNDYSWKKTPGIPRMAAGGIVTKPTIAMIGESGPEAVVPLSGSGRGAGGVPSIEFNNCRFGSDPKETAREVYTYIEQRNRGRGVST